jgi:hypothetical protein
MEKVINHNHNGLDSSKIKVYNVIPTYEMTSTQLNKYLARPAIQGEEFNVYVTDTSETAKYIMVNNEWSKVGSPTLLGAEASDTLQYSLDTERTVNGNVGGICKSIKLNVAGVVRVSWETRSKVGFTGQSGYLQLNGATIQTPSNTTSYQTLTIDVAVSFGDILALSGEYVGSANYEKYFRNFRIYYTPTDINNTTLTDTSL